jgi:hypothetical protein
LLNMTNGSDIVALLKQRQRELQDEIDRVSVALKALGAQAGSARSTGSTGSTGSSSSATADAAKPAKKKPGRPAKSIGGKTVLERIEASIASAARPLRVKEIAKLTGAPYSTLAATLRRGRDAKRLVNPSFGLWSLPRLGGGPAPSAATPAKKKPGRKPGKKATKKAGKKKYKARAAKDASTAKAAAVVPPPPPPPSTPSAAS